MTSIASEMDELQRLRTDISNASSGATGTFLFRGESKHYPHVSSTLRRKYEGQRLTRNLDLNNVQRILTNVAKDFDNPQARNQREARSIWYYGQVVITLPR